MSEKTCKLSKTALSVALAAGLGAYAATPAVAYAAEGQAKDEIVYAKASADGDTEGVYVVNVFDSDSALQVSDPANYTQVENLTTSDTLSQENGAVSVATQAGVPFYYQGTMDASTELPWNVNVTYYLDGKEVSADQLSGASGLLKVVLDVQPKENGSVSDFASSYVLQAQGTFSQDSFAIADAGDATVAHSGSNEVVTCMVLPGESATFEVTGIARDFSYSGWQIAGMPLSMSIDLASQDTSKLTDATSELEEATSKLSGGAADLNAGADAVAKGAAQVSDGAAQLSSGVESAVDGLGKLSASGKVVAQGWKQVDAGIDGAVSALAKVKAGSDAFKQSVASAADAQAAGAAQAATAQKSYASAVQAAQAAFAAYRADPTDANYAEAMSALDTMNKAAQTMANTAGAAGAYQALGNVQKGYAELGAGIDALAGESSALSTGASEFDEGLSAYLSGADDAASAADQLKAGAVQVAQGASSVSDATVQVAQGAGSLSSGTAQLASRVNGMDQQVIDGLQEAIDEKLGQDFTPHSFVVPSNTNVDAVQFVYVVDGVDEADDDSDAASADDSEASKTEKTIIDRFFALFTSQE